MHSVQTFSWSPGKTSCCWHQVATLKELASQGPLCLAPQACRMPTLAAREAGGEAATVAPVALPVAAHLAGLALPFGQVPPLPHLPPVFFALPVRSVPPVPVWRAVESAPGCPAQPTCHELSSGKQLHVEKKRPIECIDFDKLSLTMLLPYLYKQRLQHTGSSPGRF